MTNQTQHIRGERFNQSNFLSAEIPPVIFSATRYSRLRDAGKNGPPLVSQAKDFLALLREEFRHPSRDLPDYLLEICLGRKAAEVGILRQYPHSAPPPIYDATKDRCFSSTPPFYYGTSILARPEKAAQQQLFRDDVASYLDKAHASLNGLTALDSTTMEAIDTLAMFIIEFTAKSVNREPEKFKPAAMYGSLITAAQTNPTAVIRFCLDHFAPVLDEKLRKNAPDILAKQVALSNASRAHLLRQTAGEEACLAGAPLSQDERHQLMRDLRRGLLSDQLLLRALMRPFVVEDTVSVKDLNRALPPNTAEWLQTLFINGRLNKPELETFKLMSERLKDKLGTATTVSIDLGLFSWPRVTEIAAITRAKDLLIHSDLPLFTPASSEGVQLTKETTRALARREPNFLPFMALLGSAEEAIAEEKKWLQPLEITDTGSRDFSYEAGDGVRRAQITWVEGCSVRRRVSTLVGREITAPCFIVEGEHPEAPRAFGILWQRLIPHNSPNYTVENVDNTSLFFNNDDAIRTARHLRLPKVEEKLVAPPPPPSPSALVTIGPETKAQASSALEGAKRYGGDVEANEKAAPVIALLGQVINGRCPSRRDLRIIKSMEHDLEKSVVRGGVRKLFEEALPVLSELAEKVEELRESGPT